MVKRACNRGAAPSNLFEDESVTDATRTPAATVRNLLRLVVGAKLPATIVAPLLGLKVNTAQNIVRTKRASAEPMTAAERTAIQGFVKRLRAALLHNYRNEMLARMTILEVMTFPGPDDSEKHVLRLLELIDEATTHIDMAMYVVTHRRLVEALAKAHVVRGVIVRVVTDTTLMMCKGSRVPQLIESGVKVWVHERKSFMLHDKYLVLDRRVVVHGNVNWSMHAMVSSGTVIVLDDPRALLVLAGFEAMVCSLKFQLLTRGDFLSIMPCSHCAAHERAVQATQVERGAHVPTLRAPPPLAVSDECAAVPPNCSVELEPYRAVLETMAALSVEELDTDQYDAELDVMLDGTERIESASGINTDGGLLELDRCIELQTIGGENSGDTSAAESIDPELVDDIANYPSATAPPEQPIESDANDCALPYRVWLATGYRAGQE